VVWETISNYIEVDNLGSAMKVNGINAWDAGVFSYNTVQNGGYVDFVIREEASSRIMGLAYENESINSINTIDYGFNLGSGSLINIYESGTNLGNIGRYYTGDTLRIMVKDSTVNYIQNGNIIFKSKLSTIAPLHVKAVLRYDSSSTGPVTISNPLYGSFVADVNGLDNVSYQWKYNLY